MKPEVERARDPDRNTAVYRSAERLLASVPARPVPRRAARPWFVAGGLAVIVALVLLLPRSTFETADRAAAGGRAFQDPGVDSRHRFESLRLRIDEASAFAFADAAQAPSTERAVATPDARRTPTRAHAPFWVHEGSPPSTTRDPTFRHATTAFFVTSATTHLIFQGEMRSASAASVTIVFDLKFSPAPLGGLLEGSVQLRPTATRERAFHVRGVLLNHTITLNEVATPSQQDDRAGSGYGFVIELSDGANAADIAGFWTLGKSQGILLLTRAAS